MGQTVSEYLRSGSFQIVMIGLDNAGKSTTLYRMKIRQYVNVVPTIGFNCEKIKALEGKARGSQFTIWDVGGQDKLRPLWRSYIRHTDAIVFVVDSSDEERFEEAKTELQNLFRSPDIPTSVPVLLLANKQDLPNARPETIVECAAGLNDLNPSHPTHTLPCCAVTGEGLDNVLDVLFDLIQKRKQTDKGRKVSTPSKLPSNFNNR